MFSLKNILFALVSGTKREKSVLYTCTRARSKRKERKRKKEEIDREREEGKKERERGSDVFEDGTREEEGERVFNSFLHASATGCRTHTRITL